MFVGHDVVQLLSEERVYDYRAPHCPTTVQAILPVVRVGTVNSLD